MGNISTLQPSPFVPDMRGDFLLNPSLAFLNHGSFGSTPRAVIEEQDHWRERIEADPIEMLGRRGSGLIDEAKAVIGRWLGMQPANFGLVTNATEGINCVLRSLDFSPGDELLTTTHVYNAIRQAMKYISGKSGAVYREIDVPLPVNSPKQVEEIILGEISPRTKLLVIDHITSPTALVFPVESLISGCRKRGVPIVIDGAHAPGMVPLNIEALQPDYYAGNLHKWACAAKGSAFLWVSPANQAAIHPLVVSHFFQQGIVKEFGWQGTRDISAWLSIPRALKFMADIGWEKIMTHNHAMAVWANEFLCDLWRVWPISPPDGSMLGSMATIPLPAPLDQLTMDDVQIVQHRLHDHFKVEAPLMGWSGRQYIRPCLQICNTADDVYRLGEAIKTLANER